MSAEYDYDLTLAQWETLRALRRPAMQGRPIQFAVDQLIALQLAVRSDQEAVITPRGRSVLLRGSPQLWDISS
jgi:hypothetical protein